MSNIFSKLTSQYGDDVARNITGTYGDDIAELGDKSLLGRYTSGEALPEPVVVGHGLDLRSVKHALDSNDGHLINPSMQVNNGTDIGDYGNVFLLGNKDMVKPSATTHLYDRDIYSTRYPWTRSRDSGDYVVSNRHGGADEVELPATIENLSKVMNEKPLRNTAAQDEMGAISAEIARPLSGAAGILNESHRLGNKNLYDDLLAIESDATALARNMHASAQDNGYNFIDDAYRSVYGTDNPTQPDNYLKYIKRSLAGREQGKIADSLGRGAELADIKDRLINVRPKYFESKMTRPVSLNEFSGAIIPDLAHIGGHYQQQADDIVKRLVDMGIDEQSIIRYGENSSVSDEIAKLAERGKAVSDKERFATPYLLGTAGAIPTAGVLSQLFGGQDQQSPMV